MNPAANYPRYRYLLLAVFMLATIAIEIQWLTHAAVARPAEAFYAGQFNSDSFFNIDFLAMLYMLVFLVMSFPASYIIDKYGIKTGIGMGAALLGLFSLIKAIFATNYLGVVLAQTGLAIAQPFLLNAVTAFSARWFALKERALVAGFLSLAQYLGIIISMLVTPRLVGSDPGLPGYGSGFEKMLWIYAAFSVLSALLVVLFMKEEPGNIPYRVNEKTSFSSGIRTILGKRDMRLIVVLFLIGLGIFNAISSMTDSISEYLGISDSDGLVGGFMLIGGIVGAIILPLLSDRFMIRKPFIVICLAGMAPGVTGIALAGSIGTGPEQAYHIALASSFILGFFVMSAGPIGFQYAAEVSFPSPESISQGILLWVGQLTGMILVAGMSMKNNAYLGGFMNVFIVMSFIALLISIFLRESPAMNKARIE